VPKARRTSSSLYLPTFTLNYLLDSPIASLFDNLALGASNTAFLFEYYKIYCF
jgi:hypothetical protein